MSTSIKWIQQHTTDRLIETMINDMVEIRLKMDLEIHWNFQDFKSNHFLSVNYKQKRLRLPPYFYNYSHNFPMLNGKSTYPFCYPLHLLID